MTTRAPLLAFDHTRNILNYIVDGQHVYDAQNLSLQKTSVEDVIQLATLSNLTSSNIERISSQPVLIEFENGWAIISKPIGDDISIISRIGVDDFLHAHIVKVSLLALPNLHGYQFGQKLLDRFPLPFFDYEAFCTLQKSSTIRQWKTMYRLLNTDREALYR